MFAQFETFISIARKVLGIMIGIEIFILPIYLLMIIAFHDNDSKRKKLKVIFWGLSAVIALEYVYLSKLDAVNIYNRIIAIASSHWKDITDANYKLKRTL